MVAPYVKQLKLRQLTIGFDPGGLVARAGASDGVDTPFALYGMPISFLLGVTGQVEGYMTGEADWLSIEARRLFDYYASQRAWLKQARIMLTGRVTSPHGSLSYPSPMPFRLSGNPMPSSGVSKIMNVAVLAVRSWPSSLSSITTSATQPLGRQRTNPARPTS